MKNKLFSGIMPAMITPIHSDRTFNAKAAREVIEWEITHPITGFYINGATGEGPILPEKTRIEMAEVTMEICRGKYHVINHVGAPDTESAFRLAKHARQIGCSAVSSVLPNFFFQYTKDQILDYYKRIADVSELPVVVYANGLMNLDPYDFMRECIQIDGVIGLKYTIFDYYGMRRICELNDGDINVINGPDQTLLCGLVMGADGGIGTTYNVMPDWFCELYAAYRGGDLPTAQQLQYKIDRVITIMRKYNAVSCAKESFRFRGIDAGEAAYPGRTFSAEESAAIRAELKAAGVTGL